MVNQEHEFSAVHEAGHAVYVEQFYSAQPGIMPLPLETLPPRVTQIEIWYDAEKAIHDGQTYYSQKGLSNEQLLSSALSGRVAEIMARTQGIWDVRVVQQSILSGEFDHTRDIERGKELLAKLVPDNRDNNREQFLADTVSQLFSFLKTHWDLVMLVAADLLGTYNSLTRTAKIVYNNLSPETQKQLHKLKNAS